MTGADDTEPSTSLDRRTFVKRSAAASLGLGIGFDTQEQSGVQYYNVVIPEEGLVSPSFVNKFLFPTEFRRRTRTLPFEGCFTNPEGEVANRFTRGAYVYDAVGVDATETVQLFGDGGATERLRQLLEGNVDLPSTLEGSIGNVVETRLFVPVGAGRLPTGTGYRSVGGESCDAGHVRLRVHELPGEIASE